MRTKQTARKTTKNQVVTIDGDDDDPQPIAETALFTGLHHISVVTCDYEASKNFYVHSLGLPLIKEIYRYQADSNLCIVQLPGGVLLEIVSFPNVESKDIGDMSKTLCCPGMRYFSFGVDNLDETLKILKERGVDAAVKEFDIDMNRFFAFLNDPSGLPIEIYQTTDMLYCDI